MPQSLVGSEPLRINLVISVYNARLVLEILVSKKRGTDGTLGAIMIYLA